MGKNPKGRRGIRLFSRMDPSGAPRQEASRGGRKMKGQTNEGKDDAREVRYVHGRHHAERGKSLRE